jgi:hypothetical protein
MKFLSSKKIVLIKTFSLSDLGVLRAKMTEVNAEMGKLTKGIEKNNKELQSLPSLEKRVKEMAAEITGISYLHAIGY